jgi:hypothetical protein
MELQLSSIDDHELLHFCFFLVFNYAVCLIFHSETKLALLQVIYS